MKASFQKINKALAFFLICFTAASATAQTEEQGSVIKENYPLPDPTTYDAFYDVKTGMYYLYPKVGNLVTGIAIVMSPEEYQEYLLSKMSREYYKEKSNQLSLMYRKDKSDAIKQGLIPSLIVRNRFFESIFGGNKIEIIPSGFASFDLAGLYQKIDNPLILPQNRTSFAFDIEQRIQLGLLAKVGENLQLKANYDTQSGFAFENRMNLVWQAKGKWQDLQTKGLNDPTTGGEDKIVKKVEFGNINMPLSTSLIRGSESLFGLKTEFQLGKTYGTMVFSQQQGEARNIVVQGGGAVSTFKINAIDYEDNQHYFLGHYFNQNYDQALLNYPQINSRININRIEVWVIDQGNSNLSEQKSIIGIRDLGEGVGGFPDNSQNNLYQAINSLGPGLRDANTARNTINGQNLPNATGGTEVFTDGKQYTFNSKARRLSAQEFKYHPQLGYISLNQKLNENQLLAVSYSYTVNGSNQVYKVGEFSEESPVLVAKLLKPNSVVDPSSPMWDLMMKNIYSMDAYQVDRDGFLLNVYYRDPQTGGKLNYLPNTPVQDTNLLRVLNWDRLNSNNDVQMSNGVLGDGVFDFVDGITVRPEEGKIIFTKVQPFGSYMQSVIGSNDPQYVFNDLYTQLKQTATQSNLAQRYTIEGRYKGSQGQGISLGAVNVPQGSVKVTANGVQLQEGVDYTVDYLLGTVTIINEAIKQSGQAINISMENQLMFNTQRKSFLGLNLERKFNENLSVGATVVKYSETPLTQKVNFGQESVNNLMGGLNVMYNNEAPFLTRLTDKIPLINTEAPSNISFRAEGAYLLPGLNKGVNNQSYIDDFEQTTSKISLKEPAVWSLASKPEKNQSDPLFAGAGADNDITNGFGRGLLSWYNIDPRFWGIGGNPPAGINPQAVSNHASRRVQYSEIFNDRDFVAGDQLFTNTFDISYYPTQRGPYNVNPVDETTQQRWAGIMRPLSVTNFVNANIEYVEFWMMDPYADGNSLGAAPKLQLHLGNVSEDVLKDGKMQYENGLPTPSTPSTTTTSNWGTQPKQNPILYAFSTEGEERKSQDLGLDGLNGQQELMKFGLNITNPVTNNLDPASDDFVFPLSNKFQGSLGSSVIERYKYFRGPEGNSESNTLEVATQTPDAEDVNRDYNLDQVENYNQYTINLDQASLSLGQNFIVDEKTVDVQFQNGQNSQAKWYLFRIPVSQFDPGVGDGGLSVLNNVRFARLILSGFDNTSTLRFGTFDLVRSDWRSFTKNIAKFNDNGTNEGSTLVDNTNFEVGSVNIEENGLNQPPYVLPPGIERQVLNSNAGAQRQNEASLYLKATNLSDEARGVFKNTSVDMRRYKKVKMFVHAENLKDPKSAALDPDVKYFIRFGSDTTDNYYEYESSVKYTPNSATQPMDIWPFENEVDLDVQELVNAKQRRDKNFPNQIMQRIMDPEFGDDNKRIYVKGRPTLGNITTIMLGVRANSARVGGPKDVVLWMNELRLSEVDNEGGYAGNASLSFNMGDFATVNTSASYSSVGFGSIDSRPAEREQSAKSAFSINTTVNVDKFLPEKTGIKIPFNYSYSQTIEDPKYNPLDNDIEFSKAENKEELKKIARTYTQQRSIGVVNMRKERVNPDKKPKFYDIENISVTAMYNDDYYRDIYTKTDYRQYLKGYIDYNFNFKPWVIKPFNKLVSDTAKSAKNLKWFKDFNLNLVPSRISFRAEVDRNYNELEYRNIDALLSGNVGNDFDLLRNRNYYFGWQYGLGFNFTKSLKLEVNANMRTLNDQVDVNSMDRSSIFQGVLRYGRPVLYNHRVQANYRLPMQLIPYLDFIDAEASYGFTYNWHTRSSALLQSSEGSLGTIGQNTNVISATASADMMKFFGKFKYFKNIATKLQGRKKEIDSINNANTVAWEKNRYSFKRYKFKNKLTPLQSIASLLTTIKKIDFNYNENNGTTLPGLLSAPNWYGYGQTLGGPTAGFLLGSQSDIRRLAIQNGWISGSSLMVDPYLQTANKDYKINVQLMPITDFRIDISANHNYNRMLSQAGFNVDANPNTPEFDFAFASEMVTYTNSTLMLNTAFRPEGDIYKNMMAYAQQISQSTGASLNPDGYADGYSKANPYVLVSAFKAAVEGKSPTGLFSTPKKVGVPLPNWRVVYSGLKNIPWINGQFSKFDFLHGYNSTFTLTGLQSNIEYYNNPDARDVNGDVINPYIFSQVTYLESFAPLAGIDVTLRNNIQLGAQYNKDRMYSLGLVNHTLTEDLSKEYRVSVGYIIKNVQIGQNNRRRRTNDGQRGSDLNIRGDFSLRDSKTTITNILLDDSQVTGGQKLFSIKLTADYNFSQNLNFKIFYDQMMTKYKISTAFPLSTIRAGVSATFTFGGEGF